MRKQLPIEIRPAMGGHLVTAPSADAAGQFHYQVKRDWRRADDFEQRGEGHNYFRPNTGIALATQPLFASGDITLVHEVKRPNRDKCVIVGTKNTLYRFFTQTGGGYYGGTQVRLINSSGVTYNFSIIPDLVTLPANGDIHTLANGQSVIVTLSGDLPSIWSALPGDPYITGQNFPDAAGFVGDFVWYGPVTGGLFSSTVPYFDSDYFNDNPGEWLVIGTGFSDEGKRWQAVDLNGYVVLNNGVDLPQAYRVEWSEVKPIYELRELGVASVGVVSELESYLIIENVRQIKDDDMAGTMGLINSGITSGAQAGGISSVDLSVLGTIAANSTLMNTTGNIFQAGHLGKTIRFLNQFTTTISQYLSTTSVMVFPAPTEDVSGMVFVITRPIIKGWSGSVFNGKTLEASWHPTQASGDITPPGNQAPFMLGPSMVGQYYVLFGPTPEMPMGWCSAIASVTDFKTVQLSNAPPSEIMMRPFQVLPSEYLLTLTGGTFVFDSSMVGEYVISGYKKRQIVGYVDALHVVTSTDYPLPGGSISLTNPKAYSAYDGATDGYGYRVMWSLPGKAERMGSDVECSISAADNVLTLAWPMKSLKAGDGVTIVGAGVDSGDLNSTIKMIVGATVILKDVAGTAVRKITGVKAATLTHVTTTATFTSTDTHGFVVGQLVTVAGARQDDYNGAFTVVSVPTPTSFTYLMLADPGLDATAIDIISASSEAGLLQLSDSLTTQSRFEDLEDDGSEILQMRKLQGIGVIFRETSIFLMTDSGQIDPPFSFQLVYGGSKGSDRSMALAFPEAVANVKDDYLLYPGENDFYRFDLVTRGPQVFAPLHNCRNLLFDSAERGDDVLAVDNEVTKEIFFCIPGADSEDRVIRYDYTYDTVSTSSAKITGACTITRPKCDGPAIIDELDIDERWFVVGIRGEVESLGILGVYGLTSAKPIKSNEITGTQNGSAVTASDSIFKLEHVGRTVVFDTGQIAANITDYVSGTVVMVWPNQSVSASSFRIMPAGWHRFGVDYSSELRSSFIDFGLNSREKKLKSYTPHLSERYINATAGQAAQITQHFTITELVLGRWYPLGRVNVTNVTATIGYTFYRPDPSNLYNPVFWIFDGVDATPTPEGTYWELDAVNGLVRVKSIPAAPYSFGMFFTFDCPKISNAFTAAIWGGLTVAKGVTQLFSRQLTNPGSANVIKTNFTKYLYQDRVTVSGAHNSARLAMRAFEILGVTQIESNQIGRQSR